MAEVIIDRVDDGRNQHRDITKVKGVMVHRVGVNIKAGIVIGHDAISICDAFTGRNPQWESVAKATGGQNPYTFLIGGNLGPDEYDGQVWQALPIDEIGHHGRRFSTGFIGVGLIGDFRAHPPSEKQWLAAADLISDLCLLCRVAPNFVVGHGEVRGAHGGTKAPGQPDACPGRWFVMSAFRDAIGVEMRNKSQQDAIWRLEQTGVRVG